MSQRPPASRPASRSPPDSPRIVLPSLQIRDDVPAEGRRVEGQQREQSEIRGYSPTQPSSQHGRTPLAITPSDEWRAGPPRNFGVHSILNPVEPDRALGTPSSSSRRVSSGNTESPLSAAGPPSHFAPSPTTGIHTFPGPQPSSEVSPSQEGYRPSFSGSRGRSPPRRILTPKIPAPSSGKNGQNTFDARESPFVAQRGRTGFTAGSGQPDSQPMPTPPGQQQQQQHYGFPNADNPSSIGRRPSLSSMQAPARTPLSQSASPSISASSANPASSQTSPASFIYKGGPPAQISGPYMPSSTFPSAVQQAQGGGGMSIQAPSASGTEGPYSAPPSSAPASAQSAGSSRQTTDPIQLLTITTSSGVYNVPVDVHQASRLADEKRARNAGASARFRQRRKEKEKEASTTIEKMQQQTRDLERKLREIEQERDFYRGERDRFRDVIYRTPEMRHLAMQAPPSPQSMRSTSFQGGTSQLPGPPPPPPLAFQPQDNPGERPTRRRRTDTAGEFTHVPYTLPPASTLTPAHAAGYGPPGLTSLPPLRVENTTMPQSSAPSIAPVTTTGPSLPPFGTYTRSSGPYDRGWPSEGGRR